MPDGQTERVSHIDSTNRPTDPGPAIELLTIAEVARFLKISAGGVRRLQQRRLIPFIKVGGSIRFVKDDLLSFLATHRVDRVG
jgi:excisionase family DNA binding protein